MTWHGSEEVPFKEIGMTLDKWASLRNSRQIMTIGGVPSSLWVALKEEVSPLLVIVNRIGCTLLRQD